MPGIQTALTISLCLATLATSCGKLRTVSHRFALTPCPDTALVLPSEVRHDTYVLTTDIPKPYRAPKGASYVIYRLSEPVAKADHPGTLFAIRISPDDACSLDIATTSFIADPANIHLSDVAAQHDAETAVRVLLADISIHAVTPPFQVDTSKAGTAWALR